MKISFTKKILVIGSIFCGLMSPIKSEEFIIDPDNLLWLAEEQSKWICAVNNGFMPQKAINEGFLEALQIFTEKGIVDPLVLSRIIENVTDAAFLIAEEKKEIVSKSKGLKNMQAEDCTNPDWYKKDSLVFETLDLVYANNRKHLKELEKHYPRNKKSLTLENKENSRNKNEKHNVCLKAADYKGCMNYQSR